MNRRQALARLALPLSALAATLGLSSCASSTSSSTRSSTGVQRHSSGMTQSQRASQMTRQRRRF
jgi:hypothetical protein